MTETCPICKADILSTSQFEINPFANEPAHVAAKTDWRAKYREVFNKNKRLRAAASQPNRMSIPEEARAAIAAGEYSDLPAIGDSRHRQTIIRVIDESDGCEIADPKTIDRIADALLTAGLRIVTPTPNRMGTTPEMQKMYDEFDGLGWREYMRGIENGNIDPTGERLRAVCKLAREALAATPARPQPMFSGNRDPLKSIAEWTHETATPAVGGEPVAWVIPGDSNARDNGFIDAMAWQEGEFSRPLFAAQPASPLPAVGICQKCPHADFCRRQNRCWTHETATPAVGGEALADMLDQRATVHEYAYNTGSGDTYRSDAKLMREASTVLRAQAASPLRGRDDLRAGLVAIVAQIRSWLDWDRKHRENNDPPLTTDDWTHIIALPVPFWPSHGAFENWIKLFQECHAALAAAGDDMDFVSPPGKNPRKLYVSASPPEQPAADPDKETK